LALLGGSRLLFLNHARRVKTYAGLPKTHERIIYRLCGMNPAIEQRWTTYAGSCLAFAQNFRPYQTVTTIGGATQTIALGPVTSHEPVKLLSSDGGGFFNANSAHPFESPRPSQISPKCSSSLRSPRA
jgi:K+-transporting ATPase A subunit